MMVTQLTHLARRSTVRGDCCEEEWAMRLDNKVVVLTDAESETGRAIASAFAAAGANVAGFCSGAKSAEFTAAVEGAGTKAVLVEGQPDNPDDAKRLVQKTVDRFGRIDVLVNSGSTHGRIVGTIFDVTDDEYQKQLDADVKAVIVLSRAVIPEMAKHGGGSIINISSVASAGVKGRVMRSVGKAAMNALTCSMAQDHGADGVRVNGLLTGPMGGPQFSAEQLKVLESEAALKHLHTRQDEANALLFLASDESASITGALIPLDAGRSLAKH
jgi:NAD(P)-dependent dehydrogenase (short-subunit alcohol dehydrogenase family)